MQNKWIVKEIMGNRRKSDEGGRVRERKECEERE